MLGFFMAGCQGIRLFAQEHHLIDRPRALLWLAKCYAIPASMYACQIWGTRFMKQGSELTAPFKLRICAFSRVCLVCPIGHQGIHKGVATGRQGVYA